MGAEAGGISVPPLFWHSWALFLRSVSHFTFALGSRGYEGASHQTEVLWKNATLCGNGLRRTGANSIAGSEQMPLSVRSWRPDFSSWLWPAHLPSGLVSPQRLPIRKAPR